jgi:hypothetical protein
MSRTAGSRPLMLLPLAALLCGCDEPSPTSTGDSRCTTPLPAPVLQVGPRFSETADAVHYRLSVQNWPAYSDALFEASPDRPPCGLNDNSSRTWIEIYASGGTRLYGHCAIATAAGLQTQLNVPIPRSFPTPAGIYIEMIDRRCHRSVFSDVAPFKP